MIYQESSFPFSHSVCWSSSQQCSHYSAVCNVNSLEK